MINKLITNIIVLCLPAIIIGKPIVKDYELLSLNIDDWNNVERFQTIWVEERFLPNILCTEIPCKHIDENGNMVEDTINLEVFKSKSLLRKNRGDLLTTLDKLDYLEIKIGKRYFFIVVGE